MGLLALEFSDCLLDSPYFRENLKAHERQLDQSSNNIKDIVKDIQDVMEAGKTLSKAKRNLANSLADCRLECIGSKLTHDEIVISNSMRELGRFFLSCEDEMDRMLDQAQEKFVAPLESFRKEQIGSVKKKRKEFEKHTAKFCAAQDRYAGLSSKKEESLAEAAEIVRQERKSLNGASLEYVYLMHVVQERKKFEFVEGILGFMQAWTMYYKHGHSVTSDFAHYMMDLKSRVQKTRENFSPTIERYDDLKEKMRVASHDPGLLNRMYTRQGYLYVQNKKTNIKIGSQWTKYFCQYQAQPKQLIMIPYNQLTGKITTTETIRVHECQCKDETGEKFRFIVTGDDLSEQQGPGQVITHTFQAMSDYERKQWVEAMGGTWPNVNSLQRIKADSVEDNLNSLAFVFLKDCLRELEARGLSDHGLYRVGGVVSKVKKLLALGLEPSSSGEPRPLDLSDPKQWESKTIASAIKQYFRDLSKPLMTHHLYQSFVETVKHENEEDRLEDIQRVLHSLPTANREILKVLIRHLHKVACNSDKNLMTASNLGVCFGPTLLRPKEETVASIMDIKFCNEVVELLIHNCDRFFLQQSHHHNAVNDAVSSSSLLSSEPNQAGLVPLAHNGQNNRRKSSSSSNSSPSSQRQTTANLSPPDGAEVAARSSSTSMNGSSPSISASKDEPDSSRGSYHKRTKSFSSVSHWSIRSLPDEIREFRNKSVTPTLPQKSFTNDRPRSKSHQHHEPLTPTPLIEKQRSLPPASPSYESSSNQDDLMASLEMMNTLAADLPATNASPLTRESSSSSGHPPPINASNYCPLRRSRTIQASHSPTLSTHREIHKKPPLPKLSLSSSSSSSNPVLEDSTFSFTTGVDSPSNQQQHHHRYPHNQQQPQQQHQNHHISSSHNNCISSDSGSPKTTRYLPGSRNYFDTTSSNLLTNEGGSPNDEGSGPGLGMSNHRPTKHTEALFSATNPPTIPTRKYHTIFVSESALKDHLAKIEGKSSSAQMDTRMMNKISSPSPTGDSGIAGSPPVKPKQSDNLSSQEQESDIDAVSIISSALSVESDTSTSKGSKYENTGCLSQTQPHFSEDRDGDDEAEDETESIKEQKRKSVKSETSSIELDSSDEDSSNNSNHNQNPHALPPPHYQKQHQHQQQRQQQQAEESNSEDDGPQPSGQPHSDLIVVRTCTKVPSEPLTRAHIRSPRKLNVHLQSARYRDSGPYDNVFDDEWTDKTELSQILTHGQTSNV
ncbi:rho GTPase-activating protein 26-like [Tigriopus californicus]|uniref:rho GTPase-activating protein 26-like n=1 Tax=Tigriopus californicus TaxID=6832 RepID=UPI0027DA1698|nr:rho GTPase-activating protein 26-like [Tigriopus californicus]